MEGVKEGWRREGGWEGGKEGVREGKRVGGSRFLEILRIFLSFICSF